MSRNIITVLAAAALFGIGCASLQPVSMQTPADNIQASGSLRLNMSNGDDVAVVAKKIVEGAELTGTVEHVWITIKEVQIHTAGGSASNNGWKTVATPNSKFDFLELVNGLTAPLDLYALPAGHYTQIRLILADRIDDGNAAVVAANAIVLGGESFPLTIPSAYRTGIKCVRSFFIEENEVTEICLKFDALKAIHYTAGNGYMMKPAYKTYKCDGSDPGDETVSEDPESDPPADTVVPEPDTSGTDNFPDDISNM